MSDAGSNPPPSSSSPTAPWWAAAPNLAQQRPQIVQIVAKPGGFGRAVGIVLGLLLFAAVFVAGIFFAVLGMYTLGAEPSVLSETYRSGSTGTVAIIPIVGSIDERNAWFMHQAVDAVLDDTDVAAVVLRVDSPGGGVSESDQIWHEVERLKAAGLPVVASYGGVAASGGYFVSCGADEILAEQTCITGSIGVIAQVLTFQGLFEKVGIEPVTLVATDSPDKSVANDTYRTWTERDRAKLQVILDSAHEVFQDRVMAGRASAITDESRIRSLADGSIFTAEQAVKNGLIDGIGYLDDAIAAAERRAGIAVGRAAVEMIVQPPSLFPAGLFGQTSAHQRDRALDAAAIRSLLTDLSSPRALYLMR